MDIIEYRKTQFEKLKTVYSEFKTRLKLVKPDGETFWLDITNEEFLAIKKILLKKSHPVYRAKYPKK